ncbi:MAG: TolC family protein [Vicinamibacteria bacterium]
MSADYGAIGNTVSCLATFTVSGGVRVPVFEGGRVSARVGEAEARAAEARARLADLRARVYYEVQSALLDLRAAEERVKVAENGVALARQQLEQSRDRFAAGVADNLEVVQAQEALAGAEESRIGSLYAHNVARFSLARAMGGAETGLNELVKGQHGRGQSPDPVARRPGGPDRALRRGGRARAILAAVAVAAAAGALLAWWHYSGREETDDAQVEAHVSSVAPRVGGTVLEVLVKDNQPVRTGDLLVRIDPRDYQVALARAEADLAEAEASARAASPCR